MRQHTQGTSTWQPEAVSLKIPLIKSWLADVPFFAWGLFLIAAAFGLGSVLGGGLPKAGNPRAAGLENQLILASAKARDLRNDIDLRSLEVDRLRLINRYSANYRIPANRATQIYDIALSEGIDPGLAFNLVRVESGFRRTAVSPKGAIGFTQIKPSTARWLDPTVTTKDLFDSETNLHLGFRYFRYLLQEYNGDTRLALLAYNRGPSRVGSLLTMGIDPSNGYARAVLGE